MSDVFYKIKHKPSGLFYCPIRGCSYRGLDTNLSESNGRVFNNKPKLEKIIDRRYLIASKTILEKHSDKLTLEEGRRLKVDIDEWGVFEYKVVEQGEV